ncbi:Hypothetical predicted protein [Octopus vulgaris]|uniref:Uncharacterized protein n=1 Tax=Octopus vulgaris TaxID=6645 RepID=A0AA36BEP1_OCTVU|nr:Hypothetical predicted protein [Octopus vulgaris]
MFAQISGNVLCGKNGGTYRSAASTFCRARGETCENIACDNIEISHFKISHILLHNMDTSWLPSAKKLNFRSYLSSFITFSTIWKWDLAKTKLSSSS